MVVDVNIGMPNQMSLSFLTNNKLLTVTIGHTNFVTARPIVHPSNGDGADTLCEFWSKQVLIVAVCDWLAVVAVLSASGLVELFGFGTDSYDEDGVERMTTVTDVVDRCWFARRQMTAVPILSWSWRVMAMVVTVPPVPVELCETLGLIR